MTPTPERARWRRRRRLGFDSNPLRRSYDRIETVMTLTLVGACLLVAPLLGLALGHVTYGASVASERAAAGHRHPVTATLLEAASSAQLGNEAGVSSSSARVRYTAPDGRVHRGFVQTTADMKTGEKVDAWSDTQGRLVAPPRTHTQMLVDATALGLLTACGVCLVAVLVWQAGRSRLDQRRFRSWDRAWLTFDARRSGQL